MPTKFLTTIFTLLVLSVGLAADTFNAIEKSKKYGTQITNLPTDFVDEEPHEEDDLYNAGYDVVEPDSDDISEEQLEQLIEESNKEVVADERDEVSDKTIPPSDKSNNKPTGTAEN